MTIKLIKYMYNTIHVIHTICIIDIFTLFKSKDLRTKLEGIPINLYVICDTCVPFTT